MGVKTKIDWCDASWNPVTGCFHDCEYCYARGIAKRFGAHFTYFPRRIHVRETAMKLNDRLQPYPYDFEPTFHHYKLEEPQHWKKPRTIFVCSMADLFGKWVPDEWIKDVFDTCAKAPQHRYIFLTKNPGRYIELYKNGLMPKGDEALNKWYGSSVPDADTQWCWVDEKSTNIIHNGFISAEPIHSDVTVIPNLCDMGIKWIIVGAETGNRKNKVIPKREWIEHIRESCTKSGIPIFMKESLRELMGADFVQEFPWQSKKEV